MTLVLDSSVTLAWAFADEVTQAVEEVFEPVATTYVMVRAPWCRGSGDWRLALA